MTRGKRHTNAFKQEVVPQVIKHGYKISEVAANLDVTTKSLYVWIRRYGKQDKKTALRAGFSSREARFKKALHHAE